MKIQNEQEYMISLNELGKLLLGEFSRNSEKWRRYKELSRDILRWENSHQVQLGGMKGK